MELRKRIALFAALLLCISMSTLAQVVVNEVMASNKETISDEDGDYSDWIEIYNAGPSSVNLLNWSLTDDATETSKWRFPSVTIGSGGYLIVFASNKNRRVAGSELHTSFGLSEDGEYVGLYNASGQVQFEFAPEFPAQFNDVSYGLSTTSATLPGYYFTNPTPGSVNGSGDYQFKAQSPTFGAPRGYYTSGFNLTLGSPDGLPIKYTTNGSTPSASNGSSYNNPIFINKTTVIRAVAMGAGYEDSDVVSGTYIFVNDVLTQPTNPPGWPTAPINGQVFDYEMDPVIVNNGTWNSAIVNSFDDISTVSLVTDLANLVDPATGIYVNAYERWERPTSFELINPDGTPGFSVNAGLRIRGGFSRRETNPKHSFRLVFKTEYGPGKLDYPFFGDEGADKFDNLDFRTAQNYSWSFQGSTNNTFLREVTARDMQKALGQPYTRSRYHHLFINGVYFGLFMSEERPEASFGETYLGGDKDDYDVVKSAGASGSYTTEATDGTMTGDWQNLWNLSRAQFSSPTLARYMRMQGLNANGTRNTAYPVLLDVDNLVDYMLVVFYSATFDGPLSWFINPGSNNWFGLRDGLTDETGFNFIQHDGEHSFGSRTGETEYLNRVGPYRANNQGNFTYSNPQYLHQDLATTAEYKLEMSDRAFRHFHPRGALDDDKVVGIINARKATIENAIVAESARWGDSRVDPPRTKNDWNSAVNAVRNFTDGRGSTVIQQLRTAGIYPSLDPPTFTSGGQDYSYFEGNLSQGLTLTISNGVNANAGTIYYTLDGSDPRALGGAVQGLNGGDSRNVAISSTGIVKARVLNGSTWSALQTATFYLPQMLDKLVINEIHYNPLEVGVAGDPGYIDGDEFEFVEIRNSGSQSVDMLGVGFTDGIDFTFDPGTIIAPGGFLVVASNPARFQERYGFAALGPYTGNLSNGGERLELATPFGAILDSLTFDDAPPWDPEADGTGYSLSLRPGETNNSLPAAWGKSTDLHGTPNAVNVISEPPVVTITAPSNNARFDPGSPFNISVSATDPDGDDITSVRIHSGALTIATLTSTPYQTTWSPPPGSYIIQASAVDEYGIEGNANPIFVNVVNVNPCASPENVVINEVSYSQSAAKPSGDWAELYNPTSSPIDLSGWVLKDAVDTHWYVVPDGTVIGPYQYLVIARDLNAFTSVHAISNVLGSTGYGFGSSGDSVRLISPTGCEIDFVAYGVAAPWPVVAPGSGLTIESQNPNANNAAAANWKASSADGGTPGSINSGLAAPVITAIPDQTTFLGSTVNLGLSASDPNTPLTWTVSALPAGLVFNGNNASPAITGTPTAVGTTTVTVMAVNALSIPSSITFKWNVVSSTPSAQWFQPPDQAGYSSGTNLVVSLDAMSAAGIGEVRVFVNGQPVGPAVAGSGDAFTKVLTGLSNGMHTIRLEVESSTGETISTETRTVTLGLPATGPYLEAGGRVAMNPDGFDANIPRGNHQWIRRTNIPGFSGSGFMKAEPDNGTEITSNFQNTSPELNYRVRFATAGTYSVWIRSRWVGTASSTMAVGVDGTVISSSQVVPPSGDWRWDKVPQTITATAGQERLIQVWMQKDGVVIDRIVLDSGDLVPIGNGPALSPRAVASLDVTVKVQMQGPWAGGSMGGGLVSGGHIPLSQPYAGVPAVSVTQAFLDAHPEVVDWVWLDVRSGPAASSSVYRGAFLVTSDGTLMDVEGRTTLSLLGVIDGEYSVVVGHRNHLAVIR